MNRWIRNGSWQRTGWAWEQESGQAIVEVAVTLSLLVLIVLGAVQFGQIAYTSIKVANAAKAGVQYGAQSGFTAQDTSGISLAAQAAAPSLTGMTVNSSYACVCSDGGTSTCLNTDCANSRLIETVTVTTQYTLTPVIHIPALNPVIHTAAQPSTFTLSGSASQNCAQ